MPTIALVISIASTSFVAGTNAITFLKAVESLHHHTTAVVYHHVLKPFGHLAKKVAQ